MKRWRAAAAIGALLALPACLHPSSGRLTTHRSIVGPGERTWYEYRPPHLTLPAPLVVLLHGYNERVSDLAAAAGIQDEARRDGFVVALPVGMDGWNAGECCGQAVELNADDVGLVSTLISGLERTGVADPTRVIVAGFSNGAMFAYRLGCELADQISGVAVIEGTLTSPCHVHRPIDLLVIHQTGDSIVPYTGTTAPVPGLGDTSPFESVDRSLDAWRAAEDCTSAPSTLAVPTSADPVHRTSYACPASTRIEVDALRGGSHVWPHGTGVALDATSSIAIFFNLRR